MDAAHGSGSYLKVYSGVHGEGERSSVKNKEEGKSEAADFETGTWTSRARGVVDTAQWVAKGVGNFLDRAFFVRDAKNDTDAEKKEGEGKIELFFRQRTFRFFMNGVFLTTDSMVDKFSKGRMQKKIDDALGAPNTGEKVDLKASSLKTKEKVLIGIMSRVHMAAVTPIEAVKHLLYTSYYLDKAFDRAKEELEIRKANIKIGNDLGKYSLPSIIARTSVVVLKIILQPYLTPLRGATYVILGPENLTKETKLNRQARRVFKKIFPTEITEQKIDNKKKEADVARKNTAIILERRRVTLQSRAHTVVKKEVVQGEE